MNLRRLLRASVLVLLAAPVAAAAQDGGAVPLDPAVRTGTLPNGLMYYIRANARPDDRAELWLAVDAGSLQEAEDQRGLAHFLEHMAFNGTRSFPKNELIEYLQRVGMRFGADVNAYTSFDETVYTLEIPTDTAGVLEDGLRMLDDFAEGLLLDPAEIDRERGVVVEEWRLGQGAETRMMRVRFPVLFQGSRYADRLPIGSREVLETFEPATLQRFYRDWYRPDLTAVIVVGDVDPAAVEAEIKERFGDNRGPASPRERTRFPVPSRPGTRVAIATDAEATNTDLSVYFLQPPQRHTTEADYRREIVESLFAQMLNARLAELTQRPDPPFIGAGGGQGSLVRTKDVFSLGALVEEGGVLRGLDAVLTEALRIERHGFTATELERAKANRLRALERAYAERDKTESRAFASEYRDHFLEGAPAPGIAWEFERHQALVPGITLEEVDRLARQYLTDDDRVVLVGGPDRPGAVPTEAEILAALEAVGKKALEPYVDEATDAPLVARAPEPGRVVEERRIEEVGVTEWTLSNGVRVLLKPTDFKADEVLLQAYSPGGSSLAPDSLFVSAESAVSAVTVGGVGDFDAVALQKRLAGKSVHVGPSIADLSEGIGGSASAQDLETMLQLVYLYFTAPRADSAAFVSFQQRFAAFLANRSASPEQAFSDTIQVTMAQGHPRSRPFTAETVEEIDLEEAMAFYRERFGDAGDFTFVMVGAFDLEAVRPLVERWLGGLPATGREESWRDEGIRPPEGVVRKVVRRGVEPKSRTQIVFTGPAPFSREESYVLGSLTDILQDRLRERMREDLAGTYSPGVGGALSPTPYPHFTVGVGFGSAPERADELAAVVFEEIERLKTDGPTADDLHKVRETQRREWERALEENGYWVGVLTRSAAMGTDPREALAYPELQQTLTAERVREAARRYLRTDRYVRVVLQPENAQLQ